MRLQQQDLFLYTVKHLFFTFTFQIKSETMN